MINDKWHVIPNEEYHNERDGLSASGISQILKSPAHYKARGMFKQTDSQLESSAAHALILEPENFESEFYVCQPGEKRIKKLKDKYNGNVLTSTQWENAKIWRDAVYEDDYMKSLCDMDGLREVSGFTEINGVPVKTRPDFLIPNLGVCLDLKFLSMSMSRFDYIEDFFKDYRSRYNYEYQAYWNLMVANLIENEEKYDTFVWLIVQKEPPWQVSLFKADNDILDLGQLGCERALEIYKKCRESNKWEKPWLNSGIREIGLTDWEMKNLI